MSDYIQDPNDPNKQIPGPKDHKAFDRFASVAAFSMSKAPHFIHVVADVTNGLGMFFGNSASFAPLAYAEHISGSKLTGSQHYAQFDGLAAGQYHMNPIAVSGSDADVAKIKFVYKGGLDGLGRP